MDDRAAYWASVFYLALAGVSLSAGAARPDLFGFAAHGDRGMLIDLAAGLAAGVVIALASIGTAFRIPGVRNLVVTLGGLLGELSPAAMAMLAVSAGVAEEFVFRGAAWQSAVYLAGPWTALAVTSIVFGAMHGLFRGRFLAWSMFAACTGLVLGALRAWSGGIACPVAAHVVVDAVNLPVVVFLGRRWKRAR